MGAVVEALVHTRRSSTGEKEEVRSGNHVRAMERRAGGELSSQEEKKKKEEGGSFCKVGCCLQDGEVR